MKGHQSACITDNSNHHQHVTSPEPGNSHLYL